MVTSIGIADKDTLDAVKLETDKIADIKSKTDLIVSKCQLFLANGTFVVPTGVYAVYLTGCAAGNTGGAGGSGAGGAGGAGGEVIFDVLIPNLTPGQSIAITTGNGNTVFGSHLTLVKGGGAAGGAGGVVGGAEKASAAGEKGGGSLIKGTPYNAGAGGAGGARGAGGGGGGGGGGFSGAGGAGGAGGDLYVNVTGSPGVIGTGYGSGGGGGGGFASAGGAGGAGGSGGPGFLFVRWL